MIAHGSSLVWCLSCLYVARLAVPSIRQHAFLPAFLPTSNALCLVIDQKSGPTFPHVYVYLMTDPISISSAVVGGLGLALPTFQAAVNYYGSFQNAPKDIIRMREELISLIDLLKTLDSLIKDRRIRSEIEAEIKQRIQSTLYGVSVLRDKLVHIWTDDPASLAQLPEGTKEPNGTRNKGDHRLRKFKEHTEKLLARGRYHGNRTIDRTKYPFREKTIQQLQDNIDRVKANLILALQILSA